MGWNRWYRVLQIPRHWARLGILIGCCALPASAQNLDSSADLQQLRQQLGTQQNNTNVPNQSGDQGAAPIVLQPAVPQVTAPIVPSRLEQILSAKAGTKLTQFGYDQLGRGRAVSVPQTGAVQDDYVLGPGDQIVISLRGQENTQLRSSVDRNGQITIPRLPPIPATGRKFGDFRQDLNAAVHRAYVATDAYVSVGQVRQITVFVSGEVNDPGSYILTGLNSALDALALAGGIKKSGSLRDVKIQRGDRTLSFDLYNVLIGGGNAAPVRLADGDRVVVPPLGPVVAAAGLVRHSAIFELSPHQSSITVKALLALAGGTEVRGRYRLSKLGILPDGRSSFQNLEGENGVVHDSEILFAQLAANETTAQTSLLGGSGLAGNYAAPPGEKLSDVIKAPGALGASPYTLFGFVVRQDPRTLLRTLIAFTPSAVLGGTEDQALQSGDFIRVFSTTEIQLLDFVVRQYLQRLAQDVTGLRNPVSKTPKIPNTGLSASNASGGSTPSNLSTSPNVVVSAAEPPNDENASDEQNGLEDVTNVPASLQRQEIIALLDRAAPGSPLAQRRALQSVADRAFSATTGSPPFQPGQLSQSPSGFSGAQMGQQQLRSDANVPNVNADNANQDFQLPAPNYLDQNGIGNSYAGNREVQTFGQLVSQLGVDPLVLINFLVEHRAHLDGAVRGPGYYFVGPNTTLSDLVQAAGGALNWADESGVELLTTVADSSTGRAETKVITLPLKSNTLANYVVRPRDQFRFRQIFTDVGVGSVTVQGEVRSPGTFSLVRGEHLSDLLLRAGGLTSTSYPYGTVFLRRSAAQAEREGYDRAANEIENQLVVAMTRIGNDKIDPNTFASMQSFISELRTQRALGRISVVADPSVLASNPSLDPLLEDGDAVYIPQRPSTVTVLGQVMQPGSFPFARSSNVGDYIERAGGASATADASDTFVVLPDGSARKVEKSLLGFNDDVLPPGSTVVVPRDVTPMDTRQIIIDISQIFSQLAVSAASLAVLAKQ